MVRDARCGVLYPLNFSAEDIISGLKENTTRNQKPVTSNFSKYAHLKLINSGIC